ncbi:MAG: cation-translocating P-type ATPase C-terminal domain-containing protein, partial [candidate division WOR-3 bacterium]|nr:cation-translocating P-type ATPase C-terminal domain-containing protein [candidate division WOR-3 bacterium]
IKKAISYIFAINVPIAGLSFVPVLMSDWSLILLPIHIVFLELIIDPSCSVIFEAEGAEPNVMNRPPRNPKERLYSWKAISVSLLQGASVLAITLAVYIISLRLGEHANHARALTFATLVVANIGLILTNRSWSQTIIGTLTRPNKALWWVLGGAAVFLAVALYVPWVRDLFKFESLHATDVAICLGAGALSILWFEGLKIVKRYRGRKAAA